MEAIHTLADTLLARLVWTSAQASLLIGALWLLGRCLPRLSPAIRCMLWWVISVQLIVGLVASTPVELPLLSPPASPRSIAETASQQIAAIVPADQSRAPAQSVAPSLPLASTKPMARASAPAPMPTGRFRWRSLLVSSWLAGLLAQLILVARQGWQTRQLLHESTPVHDAKLQAACSQQARRLGLRRCPQLRLSQAITSPQVTGLWRPSILLPARQLLTAEESSLALAHELAHLRRGDLWLGWLPAMAQRLFFFHPLVVWAMREYALHREAACDAQVLQQHRAATQDYGRLLLRLGVARPMRPGLAGASPTFQNLKRRLSMLQQGVNDSPLHAHGWWLVALMALVGVLPYRVTAAGASGTRTSEMAALTSPPAPATAPTPSRSASRFSAHHVDIVTRSDAGDGFVLFDGDSVNINGTDSDLATAKRLRHGGKPMLWFRRGEQTYLIHDANYIQRARAAYAPVMALAGQQSQLGSQQAQLGGRQGALGARQGALATRQAQLASQQATLTMPSSRNKPSAELQAQQTALEGHQKQLDRQRDALDREQAVLGKQQQALGAQQEALGKRQQQAAEQANRQIRNLLDQAIEHDAAQKLGTKRMPPPDATQARQPSGMPPMPPAPVAPISPPTPAPVMAAATSPRQTRHRDSDITTVEPGGNYAYALYDNNARGETLVINGDHTDVATAKRLHATDTQPMFWFRRGDQAYLIRDPGYVERASAAYAPVSAYWRDAGRLAGEKWRLQGPLEGLLSRQRSVEEQRRELLADPQAPAAAPRLASLDAQQREMAAQMADLKQQLAALKPQQDAMAQRERQIAAQANQKASQLIDEALRKGLAQELSRR